jgi:hypothetical protein
MAPILLVEVSHLTGTLFEECRKNLPGTVLSRQLYFTLEELTAILSILSLSVFTSYPPAQCCL